MATLPKGGSVSGGAGSLDAHLDDMTSEANLLSTMSVTLLDESNRVKNVVFDVDFIQSAPLSPATFATAETDVVLVAGELLLRSGELGALALLLHGAVTTYHATDAALAAAADVLHQAEGYALGVAAGAALRVALIGTALYSAGMFIEQLKLEAALSVASGWDALKQKDPWAIMRHPGLSLYVVAAGATNKFSMERVLSNTGNGLMQSLNLLGESAGPLNGVWTWLRDDTPFVKDAASGFVSIAPGFFSGLTGGPTSLLAPALSALSGGPWPPTTYEQTIDRLLHVGNHFGVLEGTGVTVVPAYFEPEISDSKNISSAMQNLRAIDSNAAGNSTNQGNPDFADITIIKNGTHYTVMIPSTLAWDPTGTHAPNDLASNLQALGSAHQSDLMSAVQKAIAMEKIPDGSKVMLTGFSQGGITAAALAEYYGKHPAPNFQVTHVLTYGAPVAHYDIPATTRTLSIEHNEDFIAGTDGADNPSQANWTTIKSDVDPRTASTDAIIPAHDASSYLATAKAWDASGNQAVKSFEKDAAGFFSKPDNQKTADGNPAYSVSSYAATRNGR